MDLDYCVKNSIVTPDGTELTCTHVRDYKRHLDLSTGEEYMNDGYGYYVRRSINHKPALDQSVWVSHGHDAVRDAFLWGTRGKSGKLKLTYKKLKTLTTDHIHAILETQTLDKTIVKIFKTELNYRNINAT